MDGETLARVGYLALILAALGGWVLVEFRQRMGQALRMALAWGLIFVGMMAGYGLWSDIRRDVMPIQEVGAAGEVEVPRSMDGHYYLTLMIDGTAVPFMVDTGASGMVLAAKDAERLGIDLATLEFRGQANTANGVVRTARVTLGAVELGPFRNERFGAFVTEGALEQSLLGMDYLGQFRMEFDGGKLVLRQ
ncbi:MAG: TIGR02281 family clan AA aspartic protease [Tabrizicola sp.]|uniref:retropepsin-like aspartic protease family protein n=1 Tax=Tabrizicola sp. TaxID=2005166 RepID=UPI002AB9BE00|nr:TIGR02281 family clan AA aspartic protease [Tabrizicola sp.]MDZ4088714.1 TIGR02281 family clan AA aspartic protease [Tabrizicola sp.]